MALIALSTLSSPFDLHSPRTIWCVAKRALRNKRQFERPQKVLMRWELLITTRKKPIVRPRSFTSLDLVEGNFTFMRNPMRKECGKVKQLPKLSEIKKRNNCWRTNKWTSNEKRSETKAISVSDEVLWILSWASLRFPWRSLWLGLVA